ncbi:MAG: hypothetical protein RLN63_00310, partial [Miltoncostaeaceae bacterium]
DLIAVNKADGGPEQEARATARELQDALRLVHPAGGAWKVPVLTCSAAEGPGVGEVWEAAAAHRAALEGAGELARRRADQEVAWMWAMVHDALLERLHADPAMAARVQETEARLRAGEATAAMAADDILGALGG